MKTLLILAAVGAASYYLRKRIMATKDEVLAAIRETGAQLTKARDEIVAKIDELEGQINDGAGMDDVLSALGELRTAAQGLDDIVPDTVPAEPQA